MMISLTTYRINPYLNLFEPAEPFFKPGSEWVRDAVKGLMHPNSDKLRSKGVATSLFHNHDEKTSLNKPDYPLIIYHYTGGQFFVTGINEGAFAINELTALFPGPVKVNQQPMVVSFSKVKSSNQEIEAVSDPVTYQIHNYLALNAGIHQEYEAADALRKIAMLEEAIRKHLEKDLFKYLGIDLPVPEIKLLEIPFINPKRQTYKNHHYFSFNLKFSVNLLLPSYLALGNGKAFGYGILEQETVAKS